MITEALQKVGFTNGEINVYLSLIKLGETTTGALIKESKISGSKIYEVLNRLIEKGLASHIIKEGIRHFQALPPERITDYLDEKEKEIQDQKNEIKKIIPQLKMKVDNTGNKQSVTIYEGLKGMEAVFNDALSSMEKEDTIYVTNVFKIKPEEDIFFKHWNERRARKKVKLKMILEEEARGQFQASKKTNPLSQLKWMPKNVTAPTPINIYKDRIILFLRNDEEKPLLVVIWSRAAVKSFKLQFNLQWKQLKKDYN